jgi:anthranilate synthase component 1
VAPQVMLVDLARNDVNRVCDPLSTRVDKLMVVQKVTNIVMLTIRETNLLIDPVFSRPAPGF